MDVGPRGPRRLTARTAYLLAFHDAQDAEDLPRMVTAIERLEGAGEAELGATLRRALPVRERQLTTGR